MIVFSFFVLSLIYLFVKKSPYPAILSVLYFVIFIMEYVFMRNYLANSLLLLFLIVAFNNGKYKIITSLVLLILAFLFHTTAIVYFSFLLIYIPNLKLKKLFYLIITIVIFLFTSFTFLISYIDNDILTYKIDYYFGQTNPIGPAITHLLIVVLLLLFLFQSKNYYNCLSEKTKNNIEILQKMNVISLIYIPLYFFLPDFSRFFRVLFTVDLFFILYLLYYYKKNTYKLALISVLMVIYSLIIYQFSYSTLEYTYFPLINSNLIY
ncbi:EpsG family protein [anaerobic digester metagenome]